ncbi:hypothetical protein GCM10009741_79570 [Kribbella lupini]|uniref:Uncharacterized protein n=1 Tax=Kribbella lupini TaxID=291602 RepID=A0ABN2CPP7_9ACTN
MLQPLSDMLWYHPRMDYTAPQVSRGLFALHLIRDAAPARSCLREATLEDPRSRQDRRTRTPR